MAHTMWKHMWKMGVILCPEVKLELAKKYYDSLVPVVSPIELDRHWGEMMREKETFCCDLILNSVCVCT